MRKFLSASTIAFVIAVLGTSGVAAYGGPQTSAAACDGGKVVINVTYKVVNDVDSGVAGNNWATDNYNRHIMVRQTAPGTFCATVDYQGKFVTMAGLSPQNTGTVTDGVTGTMNGGYTATITGALLADPLWATRGHLDTLDYTSGGVSWLNQYFESGYVFNYEWWGWQYNAGSHGTWINAIDGNSGDITG